MTPAIRASQIPVPARDELCSVCSCAWSMLNGAPNLRAEWCGRPSCPCHSAAWSVALYEGSGDVDQMSSSGAQE